MKMRNVETVTRNNNNNKGKIEKEYKRKNEKGEESDRNKTCSDGLTKQWEEKKIMQEKQENNEKIQKVNEKNETYVHAGLSKQWEKVYRRNTTSSRTNTILS